MCTMISHESAFYVHCTVMLVRAKTTQYIRSYLTHIHKYKNSTQKHSMNRDMNNNNDTIDWHRNNISNGYK